MDRRLLPLFFLVPGLLLLVWAFERGELHVALLLFLPVFYGEGWVVLLGVLLFAVGVFLGFWVLASTLSAPPPHPSEPPRLEEESRRTSYGGVVLLGPIPISFGNDPKLLRTLLLITLLLVVSSLALLLFLRT